MSYRAQPAREGTRSGLIVLAATNRVDMLDRALLRPRRFDRQITVTLPDRFGREAILRVHTPSGWEAVQLKNSPSGQKE